MTYDFKYIGTELDLFSMATCWKKYISQKIKPYISGDVLEVGAGIGGTTRYLLKKKYKSWLCLEPDENLINKLEKTILSIPVRTPVTYFTGFLSDLPKDYRFDTIIYIDVLEHIKNDVRELKIASTYLHVQGRLIILSPAHQWLFTPFDSAIGHFRRYNKKILQSIAPEEFQVIKMIYLDSIGVLGSLSNKFMLNQKIPSSRQMLIWDRIIIPFSRLIDPLVGYRLGKSILGIWSKA